MKACLRCGHEFPDGCENAISVEMFMHCIWCRRGDATDDDRVAIRAEYDLRRRTIEWVTLGENQ